MGARHLRGSLQDDLGDLLAARHDLGHGLGGADPLQLLGDLEGPLAGADQFDEVERRHGVERLTVDDVVQSPLRPALLAHGLIRAQGVDDAPTRIGVHPDVHLVLGGHLAGIGI